jgi:hypothetical protein
MPKCVWGGGVCMYVRGVFVCVGASGYVSRITFHAALKVTERL